MLIRIHSYRLFMVLVCIIVMACIIVIQLKARTELEGNVRALTNQEIFHTNGFEIAGELSHRVQFERKSNVYSRAPEEISKTLLKESRIGLNKSVAEEHTPWKATNEAHAHDSKLRSNSEHIEIREQEDHLSSNKNHNHPVTIRKPKVWLIPSSLGLVSRVFQRLGFELYDPGKHNAHDWDVMWTEDYPFACPITNWSLLRAHQLINHFPNGASMFLKVRLATEHPIREIPKSFLIPDQVDELMEYREANPEKLWVQKNYYHHDIKIVKPNDIEMRTESFIQEYIEKPLLIGGRRFDVGIYTLMTSVNPLRVYVYKEWRIRFCSEQYLPFDPNIISKYVVTSSDYSPPEVLLNNASHNDNSSHKEVLLTHIKDKGLDTQALEVRLEETIRKVYLTKEQDFIKGSRGLRNFFELVRFDFLFDEDLEVYLMEVTMSPTLHEREHKIYEELIYDVLMMLGLASRVNLTKTMNSMEQRMAEVMNKADPRLDKLPNYISNPAKKNIKNIKVVSTDDISRTKLTLRSIQHILMDAEHKQRQHSIRKVSSVKEPHLCSSAACPTCTAATCLQQKCQTWCMTFTNNNNKLHSIQKADVEHANRRGFKRLFPRSFASHVDAATWQMSTDTSFQSLNPANQWMTLYYRDKCLNDIAWC